VPHTLPSSSMDCDSYTLATDRFGNNQDSHPLQGLKNIWNQAVILKTTRGPPQIVSTVAPLAVNQFETPEFNHGGREEFKGLRGFLKRSVKDLTKSMSVSQLCHKVIISGHAVPDAVVMNLEDLGGPIHAGSYWYDM
jgi:hypothetical protein